MSRPPELPERAPNASIGPYRLANRIAVGGMAEVFRAMLPQVAGGDRAVVLKRLLPHLLEFEDYRRMFEDEARLGLRVRHRNVVEVLGAGVDEGAPYIALEYVFGVDLWRLQRWLRQTGSRLRRPVALYLATELLAGLSAVHDAQDGDGRPLHIVHQDVSPSNVFLSVHGEVKLGDLGIARARLREQGPAPVATRAKGKLGYVAPEQLAAPDVDARADLFAAGVIAAEALMGAPLFVGGSELAVLLAIRDGHVGRFEEHTSELPRAVVEAIHRALAPDPEHRTKSAAELRDVLLPFVDEPIGGLARELGGLTMKALEAIEAAHAPLDRTSLARTVEADASTILALPPAARTPLPPPSSAPPTPALVFELRVDGQRMGVFGYAQIVADLHGGVLSSDAEVRLVGRADFRAIRDMDELARHLLPSARTPTKERTRLVQTSELYDLGQMSVVPVLAGLAQRRASGLLLIEREAVEGRRGQRKEVYFEGGRAAFVASSRREDLLGESLVTAGAISRDELDFALAFMHRHDGRLGDTLVACGLVEPLRLFRHIAAHTRERLLEVFVWQSGRAAFYDQVDLPGRAFPLAVDPWQLLQDGLEHRRAHGLDTALDRARCVQRGEVLAPDEAGGAKRVVAELGSPKSCGAVLEALGDDAAADRDLRLALALDAAEWVA